MNKMIQTAGNSSQRFKILIVVFNLDITRREVPAFRGAIINKVGRENVLFHNHLNQNFRYGYPLIQYKVLRSNPTIVCINDGTEEIHRFFEQTNWDITLHGEEIITEIKDLSFDYFNCGFSTRRLKYKIENWFALNESNFKRFMQLNKDRERIRFLERVMIGNIISFAKGIRWSINQQIELAINHLPKQHSFTFKSHQMIGFNLSFTTNIILPDLIGLGKSISRGFGVIRKVL
ncbi:MAG: CRISPR-associated endonuclease Cas6 [Thermodesulfobacteriota bacterium]|nr:CRISPR-associated endonuclease Cas6 [Thermodesulfobacteriota bacterium]